MTQGKSYLSLMLTLCIKSMNCLLGNNEVRATRSTNPSEDIEMLFFSLLPPSPEQEAASLKSGRGCKTNDMLSYRSVHWGYTSEEANSFEKAFQQGRVTHLEYVSLKGSFFFLAQEPGVVCERPPGYTAHVAPLLLKDPQPTTFPVWPSQTAKC